MHRRGTKQNKKKSCCKGKSKPTTPEKQPHPPAEPFDDEHHSVRTITFQNGEVIDDSYDQGTTEDNDIFLARQVLRNLTHNTVNTIHEMIDDITIQERKLINSVNRNYENLVRELKFSFDCDSVVVELPYVRRIYGVDELIEIKRKQDEEMTQLIKDINSLFGECEKKHISINNMKTEIIKSIDNYNKTTKIILEKVESKKQQ
ncbi:hypothetical protein KM1_138560 [Entamoeba histolytica HM-3:IMSS]|uniref:Uncharacterized protein n=6 Tax=Entamoeba histolytica TaxID=5759 RepID=C4LT50_ENTH1|nr:hypothetical protein EHI_148830 [Entamoeba histolytica HM-1:IMSS]EMD44206.1 Hypothetical protein EHI5A_116350 [Entamoeba histolytica KU27]EMS13066.1 hypothetical protein KM1_138560 [Entamoeba histolytica HM-3:IMSS]ENY65909.1 hypothetical protein EHI7A_184850 [Entamoeba histolytica HM-1:IMSS-A]GAT91723.1 hypothetical protein CL6EHI_148830 [Entamoeba histolytica]EAL52172.1 hypothetical protein EHI_148830 [Entamoeba histolytica HM-1:IMSS]|eukprot:XP_657583.1 hypothetical protein EHI_148830 [Entamoeba histolytica HM-1:IMSS]